MQQWECAKANVKRKRAANSETSQIQEHLGYKYDNKRSRDGGAHALTKALRVFIVYAYGMY